MKKILLLCQQRGCPIELSPARYQLIDELKRQDYEIYVFFPGSILNREIKGKIQHFTNTLHLSTKDIRKKILYIEPRYVIAFTYEDAEILYSLPWRMKKTIFIYYNLEIYTPKMEQYLQPKGGFFKIRCRSIYMLNKVKEIVFTKNCELFVIQDILRKKTSAKYHIWHPNTMLIPNSYVFGGNKTEVERYGMVYSGGLNKIQLESLIVGLNRLPDLPITFSGWSDTWFMEQCQKIRKLHPSIKVCIQKLTPEELSSYLRNYAIGLIWYSPTKDENINNIGLASGKFFKHLSLEQPVIVMDCPGISSVVKKYQLGIVIHDTSEIKSAYEQIMKNYWFYQKRIRKVYINKYNYSKVIQPFMQWLEEKL